MTMISTGWLAAGWQGAGSDLKVLLPSFRYFLKAQKILQQMVSFLISPFVSRNFF